MTLDAGEVYSAVRQFGLVAVAKEIYSDGEFESHHSWTFSLFPLHLFLTVCVDLCTGGCILSVAVVNNSSLDISSLHGLRSCHSGVRWTAGWSLPLGFLLSRNYLNWSREHPLSHGSNIIIHSVCIHTFFFAISGSAGFHVHSLCVSSRAEVGSFFRASCVPGAAALAPSLCALCQGEKSYSLQKNYHCEMSHNEPFYNSQGALRSGATNNAFLFFSTWL